MSEIQHPALRRQHRAAAPLDPRRLPHEVTLDGERIIDAEMVLGYLHRCMEKLAEERTYTQNIPFTDRMDYLAAMTGNLGYCLAAEKLAGVEVPERGSYLRVIFAELQRIASHCMANGTFVNDCGAWQTPLMYMFREREKILDLFEMTCGARLTTNYMRIGGVAFDVPDEWYPAVNALIAEMPDRIAEYEELLLDNEILLARSRDVGVLKPDVAINAVGQRARAARLRHRLGHPQGRPVLRLRPLRLRHPGRPQRRLLRPLHRAPRRDAPERAHHQAGARASCPAARVRRRCRSRSAAGAGEAYARIESPKGELGFYLVSDGGPAPYRFHVRSPSFINLSVLKELTVGLSIADAIVTLGSLDINVGEIDR